MTTTAIASASQSMSTKASTGAIAGLIGGVVFGIMMTMMGSIKMIAQMMGSDSAVVGWMVHLMISAIFGIAYAILFSKKAVNSGTTLSFGMIYGVILWVFGPLIMMPLMMGMSSMMFHVGEMQWMSLIGHIMFGVITAFVFFKMKK